MWTGTRCLALPALAGLTVVALIGMSPAPDASGPVLPVPVPSIAAVAIIDVVVSPEPIQANKPVSLVIHTTPNAVRVQVRVLAHSFTIPKTGEGVFSGAGAVPWWARFIHGAFKATFVATDAGGETAQMDHSIRM